MSKLGKLKIQLSSFFVAFNNRHGEKEKLKKAAKNRKQHANTFKIKNARNKNDTRQHAIDNLRTEITKILDVAVKAKQITSNQRSLYKYTFGIHDDEKLLTWQIDTVRAIFRIMAHEQQRNLQNRQNIVAKRILADPAKTQLAG